MLSHERLRNVGKTVTDDGVVFPPSVTSTSGAAGVHARFRRGRHCSQRRMVTLLLRLVVLFGLVFLAVRFYQSFYATHLGESKQQQKQERQPITKKPETSLPNASPYTPSTTPAPHDSTPPVRVVPTTATPTTFKTDGASPTTNLGTTITATITTIPQPEEQDRRTARPDGFRGDRTNQREEGEYELEEPERMPGLRITRRTYTPDELLERFQDTTFIYSFVNGSELHHAYRKEVRSGCITHILAAEAESYQRAYPTFLMPAASASPTTSLVDNIHHNSTGLSGVETFDTPIGNPFARLRCTPNRIRNLFGPGHTLGELLAGVEMAAHRSVDNRDRETDELRHSVRSLEQHVRWHRGRVVVVSPGHHPTWVDGAKNFLAGACGDASVQALRSRGTHLRLTTVHQDAVMPYGEKLTADSHVIEQHLWRVRNTTAVHVYMNDDYFVNRDVAITDLFNEYGGTIVRTEGAILNYGSVADHSASWSQGVLHTQQFNIQELDVHHEDYLPDKLIELWVNFARLGFDPSPTVSLPVVRGSNTNDAVHVGRRFLAEPMMTESVRPRRPRRYATHAPFVYCTNMLRFFSIRYEREFAFASLNHRSRMARDLFIPFLYNAFIMARPWQASPQFLPYLLQLHRSRRMQMPEMTPALNILLDNFDGCAPASLRGGEGASECTYGKFQDNSTLNDEVIKRIENRNPLYFNINAGFTTPKAADQLRNFIREKFPEPLYLETTSTPPSDTQAAMNALFDALMALPVVGVVSYDEGACPLVRSLSLAFAGHHRGRVYVAVQRHGGEGDADETLREIRLRLENRIWSATPVLKCAYGSQVKVGPCERGEGVADIARRVLRGSDGAGVALPWTCGAAGGDGAAGLRVRGFVIDARTPQVPVKNLASLPDALAMPGQTLALEDFRAVRVGPEDGDVVLVLARADAAAKAVHWINGASESDLLVTFPLPVREYEDLGAQQQWSQP